MLLTSYGWPCLLLAVLMAFLYSKFKPNIEKWKRKREDEKEAELIHKSEFKDCQSDYFQIFLNYILDSKGIVTFNLYYLYNYSYKFCFIFMLYFILYKILLLIQVYEFILVNFHKT